MAAFYDLLVGGNPDHAKMLDELLQWARDEAITEEIYNREG